MSCDHAEDQNPRHKGICAKCGRLVERDTHYEDAFLKAVTEEAQRQAGLDVGAYPDRVRARLAIGAERYGDKPRPLQELLGELCDEPPDIAGWALRALLLLNEDSAPPDNVYFHLFQASVLGAMADWHARAARIAAREG